MKLYKKKKVLEALRHAPRPFILYVTKRDDARRWLKILRSEGLTRIDCFHGETSDADRQRIIDQWAADELDGVVATSAFGVGIDKGDVRTILHATVPETLDRFYQEVGRGGRDGKVSCSLMLYSQRDREIADSIGAPTLISDQLGFERWYALSSNARPLDRDGFVLEIDLDVVPPRLRRESDYNAAWNMRTLIMMARAGMLDLESRAPEVVLRLEQETEAEFELRNDTSWTKYFRKAVVRMSCDNHRTEAVFNEHMGGERTRSLRAATSNREFLNRLLEGRIEVSALLDDLYRSHSPQRSVIVSRACGGCPEHRRSGIDNLNYLEPLAFGIEEVVPSPIDLFRIRFPHLDPAAPIIVPLPASVDEDRALAILLDLVTTFGIREIAIPAQLRDKREAIARFHKHTPDHIILLHSIEEEEECPSTYKVLRATLLLEPRFPPYLTLLDRPLHIILAPAQTPDPQHFGRLLSDTGTNTLSYDQLTLGVRI